MVKQRDGLGGVRRPLLASPPVTLFNGTKSTSDSGNGNRLCKL